MGLGKCHRHPFPLSSSLPDPAKPAAPTDLDLDSSAAAALENGQNDAHLLPPFGRGGAPPPSTWLATDLVSRVSWKPTDLDRRKAGSLSINRDTTPSAPIPPLPPTDPVRSVKEIEDREEDDVEEEEEEDEERRKQPQGRSLAQCGQRRSRRSRMQPEQTP
ncbi:hypothetical protein OPV22_005436 [Ensete ventricosum]|uniref:Uncharacterized protein n=1 Tax=Ensete ventricosum TaxID=4639 RepID=A0AAV8RCT4_ENSVE|nr:hypothetical protein OPV22_005436 [Ensete ventricosum]